MADTDLPQDEPLEDETVFWEAVFGTPAGCNMVRNLRSIQDILSMRVTSKNFSALALNCVEHMRSDNTVQVPLSIFSNYSQLKSADNVFFTIFTEADAIAISTMPKLVKANFLFQQARVDLFNMFRQNLTTIATGIDPLTGKRYADIRQLPGMNVTIGFLTEDDRLESVVSISDKKALIPLPTRVGSMSYRLVSAIGRGLLHGEVLEVYYLNAKHLMHAESYNLGFPPVLGLTVNNNLEFTNGDTGHQLFLNELKYVRLNMVNFLQKANLGLFNPSLPPSDDNKPLKTYIPLTMSGISSHGTIEYLLYIYIYYIERLFNTDNTQIYHFNDLMRLYLSQYVEEINNKRAASIADRIAAGRNPNLGGEQFLMDMIIYNRTPHIINYSFLNRIISMEYKDVSHMNQSLDAIRQHGIIPHNESDIVQNTANIYDQLRRAGSFYYLEDGTTAQ